MRESLLPGSLDHHAEVCRLQRRGLTRRTLLLLFALPQKLLESELGFEDAEVHGILPLRD